MLNKIKNLNLNISVRFQHLIALFVVIAMLTVATPAQVRRIDKRDKDTFKPKRPTEDTRIITPDQAGISRTFPATIPITPDVPNLPSEIVNGAREFRLTASVFQHQLSTFPKKFAEVWGYNNSIPGPTAIAYEGEKLRFVITNLLPDPTTVHFHGLH